MIEALQLTKCFGAVKAVNDVSFTVARGEIVGFLGPNGAGKTTTMRLLTGFYPPTSGRAVVAGHDVQQDAFAVKKAIGYLPEHVPLYEEMRVRSFLRYVGAIKGLTRGVLRAEINDVIERCGLGAVADRVIGHLSRGYRQRVGLAQALMGKPPVLILDEPTVGLDPKQIIEIRQVIKDLASDHTVLLSTHILPEVSMLCERVIIIHEGRIVAEDRMADLARGDRALIHIETSASENKVREALGRVKAVSRVDAETADRYVVETEHGPEALEAVSEALIAHGCGLRRIHERTRTLEDVFIEVVSMTDEGGTA